MMILTRPSLLTLCLTTIQISQAAHKMSFSRGVETLREHLASDLGFSTLPRINKANLSMTEYINKMEIYQKILRQSENIKRIQDEFQRHRFTTPSEHLLEMSEFFLLTDDVAKINFDLTEFDKLKFGSVLIKSAKLNLSLRRKDHFSILTKKATVIQIIDESSGEGTVVDSQDLNNDASDDILVSFDLTDTLQAWTMDGESQKGLKIEATGFQIVEKPGWPTLVVDAEFSLTRHRRSVLFPGWSREEDDVSGDRKCGGGATDNKCCRDDMMVNFKDLQGFDFILEPTEFNAFMCRGKCPARFRPLNDHSLLQSLMHIKQQRKKEEEEEEEGERIKRPCCVPAKLSSLPILHLDEQNPAKLKVTVWKSIIVTECACG